MYNKINTDYWMNGISSKRTKLTVEDDDDMCCLVCSPSSTQLSSTLHYNYGNYDFISFKES